MATLTFPRILIWPWDHGDNLFVLVGIMCCSCELSEDYPSEVWCVRIRDEYLAGSSKHVDVHLRSNSATFTYGVLEHCCLWARCGEVSRWGCRSASKVTWLLHHILRVILCSNCHVPFLLFSGHTRWMSIDWFTALIPPFEWWRVVYTIQP